ncbi:MAG: disulfide reductase [Chloroflexi bacterium]|nr:MAG: disulfide reductase [Chloroflexota bacterium]MBL1197203.1 disulfide reductase [Chloroflexota bacterium]NOH14497.1 CoB--CoM heterodisulfide reductase iron-sulfur subunit B family protein [Chloroflexota bacterium]
MKYMFYPGCSLHRSARPYLDSLAAIQEKLTMELQEVEDWNCCGATEYMSVYRAPAHALVGRNLALAQQQSNGSDTVMAACSACYLNLEKTENYMRTDEELNNKVNTALAEGDLHYDAGSIQVRHLLDIIYNDVGMDRIKNLVTNPLEGLKVAAYYGCMIVRPDVNQRWNSPEYPTVLEELMEALGAEVIDFPMKTHCCSGHMTQISSDVAYELIRRLIYGATHYEADILVTLCPMCQLNLDAYQIEMNNHFDTDYVMPILYFTQLMGLAFGIEPEELGIGREFVSAKQALAKIGAPVPDEVPEKGKPRRKKKKEEGLPMPQVSTRFNGGSK